MVTTLSRSNDPQVDATPSAVVLDQVTRRYGSGPSTVVALDDVSLQLETGEFLAVMGPSGSGKSTLLNLIGALDRPNAGRIDVAGDEISRMTAQEAARYRRRAVGFIFQSFNLLPRLTVLENVALPLMFDGIGRAERQHRAADTLTRLGLEDRLQHRPPTLSGGEKQRVAIARALVNRPALLLADEPTGNLDSGSARIALELMAGLNRDLGQTILLITHDSQVASYAQGIVRMRDGRIAEDDRRGRHLAPTEGRS